MSASYDMIVVTGPTATGKTEVAVRLAHILEGEVLSADSRQVYKGMNLGTGKDLEEFRREGLAVPYHLIDIAEAGDQYNVFEYQKAFLAALSGVRDRKCLPILCGGSGMYLDAVLEGYRLIRVPPDPALRKQLEKETDEALIERLSSYKKLHNHTDTDHRKRMVRAIEIEEYLQSHPEENLGYPEIHPLIVGISFDREERRQRITERLSRRLNEGMVEEVQNLLNSGLQPEQLEYYGLEYKFITRYLVGKISYQDMFNHLNTAIHQFAKRQMTWFRRMERNGHRIHWLDGNLPIEEKLSWITSLFFGGEE